MLQKDNYFTKHILELVYFVIGGNFGIQNHLSHSNVERTNMLMPDIHAYLLYSVHSRSVKMRIEEWALHEDFSLKKAVLHLYLNVFYYINVLSWKLSFSDKNEIQREVEKSSLPKNC